jgi:hypothetical protein
MSDCPVDFKQVSRAGVSEAFEHFMLQQRTQAGAAPLEEKAWLM